MTRPVGEAQFADGGTVSDIDSKMCSNVNDADGDGEQECVGEADTFDARQVEIYSYLRIHDVESDLFVQWKWYDPLGELYTTLSKTIDAPANADNTVVASSAIGVRGSKPSTLSGRWEVRVSVGPVIQLSDNFVIDEPPTTNIEYSPVDPSINSSVTFSATESVDPDGRIVAYRWDFDSDGEIEATGKSVEHTLARPGDVTVELTVTDDLGVNTTTTTTVHVNFPPEGDIRMVPPFPSPAGATVLIANASDRDGSIVAYHWDLGRDESEEVVGPQVERRFDSPGTYNVSVRIVDDAGDDTVVERRVTVYPDSDDDILVNPRESALGTDQSSKDTDGDGLGDGLEVYQIGTEPTVADTDGDGLADGAEVDEWDTDPTVADTDGDDLDDGAEINEWDIDPTTVDTDGDGLDDGVEVRDYGSDPADVHSDDDGLADGTEVDEWGTDPTANDSDDDGLSDGVEVREVGTDPAKSDTDGDRLVDGAEVDEWATDPKAVDTDGDDLDDGSEVLDYGSDPTAVHSDGDGFSDGVEARDLKTDPTLVDTDGDGLDDRREVEDLDTDPTLADTDDDGLDDRREVEDLDTDPTLADTDGDGLDDRREVEDLDADSTLADTDGDGLADGEEVRRGLDPASDDTDHDFFPDGGDVAPAFWLLPLGLGYGGISLLLWLALFPARW